MHWLFAVTVTEEKGKKSQAGNPSQFSKGRRDFSSPLTTGRRKGTGRPTTEGPCLLRPRRMRKKGKKNRLRVKLLLFTATGRGKGRDKKNGR